MIPIKNVHDLINVEKTLKEGKAYLNKLNRALLYRGKAYETQMPSIQESDDIYYKIDAISQWNQLNINIKGVQTKEINQISPLLNPLLSPFYNNPTISRRSFHFMKNFLKESDEQRLDKSTSYDPSKYPILSKEWCVSRLFDMTRSILVNVENQINQSIESAESPDVDMMTKQKGSQLLTPFKYNFTALEPILSHSNNAEKNIVTHVKNCRDNKIYQQIITEQMEQSQERSFLSPSEFNISFEQNLNSNIMMVESIQASVNTPIGKSIYNAFKEKKL